MRRIKVPTINPGKFLLDKFGSMYIRSLTKEEQTSKNPVKIYEYNVKHNILPEQVINEMDGTCTFIYSDGSVIRIKATVTELKEKQNLKKLNLKK